MKRQPTAVSVTLILIGINAAFWLAFPILVALGATRSGPQVGAMRLARVILALGSSVILAGTAILLGRRNRLAYYPGVVLLAMIAVLSITDQFGLLDLFTLSISLVAIGLMLWDRAWYLQSGNNVPFAD